jgi:hypothetical protein
MIGDILGEDLFPLEFKEDIANLYFDRGYKELAVTLTILGFNSTTIKFHIEHMIYITKNKHIADFNTLHEAVEFYNSIKL